MAAFAELPQLPIGTTLAVGWRLFVTGLKRAFPWVLVAELLPLLIPTSLPAHVMSADFSQLADLNLTRFGWVLLIGCAQALFYGIAIIKLSSLVHPKESIPAHIAVTRIPALFIANVIYNFFIYVGGGIALVLFLLTALSIGILPGVLITLIPLAPTAYLSTLFALFAYPAVLERKGPFAALNRSSQLTSSNWVRAALIISVPAIVLLVIAVGGDALFIEGLLAAVHQAENLTSDGNIAQLQHLLLNTKGTGAVEPFWWDPLFSILGAFGWWYALAVCYAEYLELSDRAAH